MFHRILVFIGLLFTLNDSVLGAVAMADVAVRYHSSVCAIPCQTPQSRDWFFWRGQNRIEVRDASGKLGELWRRDASGGVSYLYLEPADKRGIEYSLVDLKLVHRARPWEQLASFVSPAELGTLSPSGRTEYLGRQAVLYKGKKDNRQTVITWLPELQLAARVEYVYPDRRVVTELKSFLTEQDGVVATSDAVLSRYEIVDFADVGDNETNESMAWLRHSAAPGHESHRH
jgi:hypothetical protein